MSNEKTALVKYALIPTVIVLFLAVYPQLNIWLVKGSAWHGAFVVSNYDEVAYSAYVNSLIEGRPRKTDPFIGQDNITGETLYSIQAVPAYAIAVPARALGISAASAFVILNFLIAIFSSLAVFGLLRAVTGDNLLAGVGVLAVLCLGTAAAFQGELHRMVFGNTICDFFPFLRRYQPGLAFPLFFVSCLAAWKLFTVPYRRTSILFAGFAGILFSLLVFSYFYLWTAAAAWFICLSLLWMFARRDEIAKTLSNAAIVAVFGLAALVPYFILLANRLPNTDETQLLTLTRSPNIFELPEIIGIVLAAAVLVLIRMRKLDFRSAQVLFTLSLAITPVILFNQQVVTGRSLQPVHYAIFIANYLVMTAFMLFVWLVGGLYAAENFSRKFRRGLVYLAAMAMIWGFIESTASARRNAGYESLRDEAMPVLTYLHAQEKSDGNPNGRYPTVISTDLMVADFIPTVTSYRSLWNPHTNSAGGVNLAENKGLFYRYLYYSGFDEKDVANAIDENLFELMTAFFGGGRALAALDQSARPITRAEMDTEIKNYARFRAGFDRLQAADPELSYIIVPAKAEPDFQKLDQWYKRDEGRVFGAFKLYKLQLKP